MLVNWSSLGDCRILENWWVMGVWVVWTMQNIGVRYRVQPLVSRDLLPHFHKIISSGSILACTIILVGFVDGCLTSIDVVWGSWFNWTQLITPPLHERGLGSRCYN